jgi:GT2 family glycosyltransferase
VAAVAGRIVTRGFPLGDRPSVKSRLPIVGWLFFNYAQMVSADVVTGRGCNLSVRRHVLEALGGFDERFEPGPASCQEVDLCFRLRRCGWRQVFEPTAAVEHLMWAEGGTRAWGQDPGKSWAHHANLGYFFWKSVPAWHRPVLFPALLALELRASRAGLPWRGWRASAAVARLFVRGMRRGWRLARAAPLPAPEDPITQGQGAV